MLDDKTIFSIHWFSITVWQPSAKTNIVDRVLQHLGLAGAFVPRGSAAGRGYKRILFGNFESKLYLNPYQNKKDESDGYTAEPEHFHLELTGDACDAMNTDNFVQLFRYLTINSIRFNVTRLDIALDSQAFTVSQVAESVIADKFKTRVHRENITRFVNLTGSADTLYFGSPSSDTRLRIYKKRVFEVLKNWDKEKKSGNVPVAKPEWLEFVHPIFGKEYFTRVELQVRDSRATHLFQLLMVAEKSAWMIIAGASINDFVSIIEDYWVQWLEDIPKGALLKISHPPKSMSKTARWLHTQVAPSLSMYVSALAGHNLSVALVLLQEIIDYGQEKWGKGHIAIIENHKTASNITDVFAFVSDDLKQKAAKMLDVPEHEFKWSMLDVSPIRQAYYKSLSDLPYWFKKFKLENPMYESLKLSHFEFMPRLGWVMDYSRYYADIDNLPDEKEPVDTQLRIWSDDTLNEQGVNRKHHDKS